ncbi:hypothetical protein NPIL_479141 [Nephila pilipes]|uniref:Uncharacterized protein n=1 Tax=Nephila pilipes TaxID=299642 RepID=A0A8X6R646_NEPPI|nr:hypothetical protein NPIL_479141 [Nephila pilipes]
MMSSSFSGCETLHKLKEGPLRKPMMRTVGLCWAAASIGKKRLSQVLPATVDTTKLFEARTKTFLWRITQDSREFGDTLGALVIAHAPRSLSKSSKQL